MEIIEFTIMICSVAAMYFAAERDNVFGFVMGALGFATIIFWSAFG